MASASPSAFESSFAAMLLSQRRLHRDASYPILPYLCAPSDHASCLFSPASTIFPPVTVDSRPEGEEPITILELGSGQSMATIHLLDEFKRATDSSRSAGKRRAPKVFLSDLPDVLPLCRRSVERWQERHEAYQEDALAMVDVVPLSWGDLEMGDRLAKQLAAEKRTLTHVLLIDLVSHRRARIDACGSSRLKADSIGIFPSPVSITAQDVTTSDKSSFLPTSRRGDRPGGRSRGHIIL